MKAALQRCSLEKVFQKNAAHLPENKHGCSPVHLLHIFRTLFPKNTSSIHFLKRELKRALLTYTYFYIFTLFYIFFTLIYIKETTFNYFKITKFYNHLPKNCISVSRVLYSLISLINSFAY